LDKAVINASGEGGICPTAFADSASAIHAFAVLVARSTSIHKSTLTGIGVFTASPLLVLVGGAAAGMPASESRAKKQIRVVDLYLCRYSAGHPVLDALNAPVRFVVSEPFAHGDRAAELKNSGAVFIDDVLLVVHDYIKHYA
jgi:hypothetical protein